MGDVFILGVKGSSNLRPPRDSHDGDSKVHVMKGRRDGWRDKSKDRRTEGRRVEKSCGQARRVSTMTPEVNTLEDKLAAESAIRQLGCLPSVNGARASTSYSIIKNIGGIF